MEHHARDVITAVNEIRLGPWLVADVCHKKSENAAFRRPVPPNVSLGEFLGISFDFGIDVDATFLLCHLPPGSFVESVLMPLFFMPLATRLSVGMR